MRIQIADRIALARTERIDDGSHTHGAEFSPQRHVRYAVDDRKSPSVPVPWGGQQYRGKTSRQKSNRALQSFRLLPAKYLLSMTAFLLTPPAAQDVHIWRWNLDVSDAEIDGYWQTLSEQERERAGKFRFDLHRRRFVAGRGELRRLLGAYLGLAPHAVSLDYGTEGKPFCTSQPAHWTLCFNLSHSDNTAALAVSNGIEIGIDVEIVRPVEESMPVEVFSTRERAQFATLPEAQRQAVFFETWARKEACLKALGTGFILPPDHFEFDLAVRGDTTPCCVGGDAHEAAHWRIQTLQNGMQDRPDCAGAVAARHADWSLVFMNS
ncbi:4'-phosphopantetheinyl transferase family protein [Paraburkholderia sp. J94]|uniref:4'-phosphopantetheinyl transferase family protein n=1 Tax=Paraburkholderia sp. J94 TaxID=2805441 RepID=UPI002AB18E8A|nr:4'-phosphopantetheinyl transferase superfamily protein [Paraburkholderia sp. J94]